MLRGTNGVMCIVRLACSFSSLVYKIEILSKLSNQTLTLRVQSITENAGFSPASNVVVGMTALDTSLIIPKRNRHLNIINAMGFFADRMGNRDR